MADIPQQPRPRLLFGKRLAPDVTSYDGVRPHRGAVVEIVEAMAAEFKPACFEDRYVDSRKMMSRHGTSLSSQNSCVLGYQA